MNTRKKNPLFPLLKETIFSTSGLGVIMLPEGTRVEINNLAEFTARNDLSDKVVSLKISEQDPRNNPTATTSHEAILKQVQELAKKLDSPQSPIHLTLNLYGFYLKNKCIEEIAKVLNSPFIPQMLTLTAQFYNSAEFNTFIHLLSSPNKLNYLEINVEYSSYVGLEGIESIATAIEKQTLPDVTIINLVGSGIGGDAGIEYLANALKKSHAPNSLILVFGNAVNHPDLDNNFTTVGAKKLADAMLYNTSVVHIDIRDTTGHDADEYLDMIRLCCLRNKLIHLYPQYESYIKKVSFSYGLYMTNTPLPLKLIAANFLINHEAPTTNLPIELQEYMEELALFKENLSALIQKEVQVTPP